MKRLVRFVRSALAAWLIGMSTSHAVEILHWERLPLAVPLVVGQERVVFIDHNVRVGVPASVSAHLRVQSAGGALYLKASDGLPPTRLQLQDAATGELILLDIAAEPAKEGQPPLEPVRIVATDASSAKSSGYTVEDASMATGDAREPTRAHETPIPVVLTRNAAQNLYAPLRTVEPLAGVARINIRRDLPLHTLLPTLPVQAEALGAWRLDNHWVTAVRLTNTSWRWLDLDPRALQGDFVAATFQHPNLGPAGESSDTTVLYLVTRDRGLAESLLPRVSPIEAVVNLPPAHTAGATEDARDDK